MALCGVKRKSGIQRDSTLDDVMTEMDYFEEFYDYLSLKFASEVLDFVVDVSKLSVDETRLSLDEIFETYIPFDAPRPICFENESVREKLVEKFSEGDYDETIFDEIEVEMRENLNTHLAQLVAGKFPENFLRK